MIKYECLQYLWLNYIQVFASTKTRNRKNFYKELLKYFPSDSEEPQFSEIFQILKFKNIMNRLLYYYF